MIVHRDVCGGFFLKCSCASFLHCGESQVLPSSDVFFRQESNIVRRLSERGVTRLSTLHDTDVEVFYFSCSDLIVLKLCILFSYSFLVFRCFMLAGMQRVVVRCRLHFPRACPNLCVLSWHIPFTASAGELDRSVDGSPDLQAFE